MDPDIPVPSIENGSHATVSITQRKVSPIDTSRSDHSPSKTPFKTPRSTPGSPAVRSLSRSPSATSLRNERQPPKLQRKTSTPNFSPSRATSTATHQAQYRRTSSILNPGTPTKMKPFAENPPPRPQWTASTVAQDYFRKELETHETKASSVAVIVHDSCYGHRYTRPRTSKATLASIVERPERIQATLLGVSTAYVRLGDRHKDGQHHPHPNRDASGVPDLPFVVRKTTRFVPLNHPAAVHVHGSRWMEELQIMCDSAEANLSMSRNELSRPVGYGRDDKGKVLPALHSGDLYLSSESLNALQGCLGGVCDAVDLIYQSEVTRRAFVCIRPPGHHCSSNFPSGFCWLNNVHVGITYAAMNHGLTHAAIIDFDLHHGDGSQSITWNHNRNAQVLPKNAPSHKKTPIGYYSLHDINSYPCEMGDEEKVRNASTCLHNAHGQSIWNVHLEPWKSREEFWTLYESKYKVLLEKTRSFLKHHSEQLRAAGIQPKPAIFLSSGFDASEWESEGMQRHKVNVPTDFYAKFTADVVDLAAEPDLAVDGRVISVLEGGYSDRALTSGVLSHICGLAKPISPGTDPMATVGGIGITHEALDVKHIIPHNPGWWAVSELEALERVVAGHLPPPKKMNDKPPGSYSSPTQASTARMTDVARERRSLSAQLEARLFLDNAPLEPPPEVDWTVAAYELSQLIIPKDRQTQSCTHEELNAEATKARRERQSTIGVAAVPIVDEKRQLRDRKPKPIQEIPIRSSSRNGNRRTTIASVSDLPDPSMPDQSERPRRRSSAASSVLSSFQDLKLGEKENTPKPRPSSAQGSRKSLDTASSTGSTTTKKAKAPVKKTTGSRTNSPRKPKAQPLTTGPASSAPQTLSSAAVVNPQRPSLQSRQSSSANTANNDGMNDLTNGMKKVSIKLKMPTEEQHIENQKKGEPKSAETAKQPKPKIVKKPAVPKAPRTNAATSKTTKGVKDKDLNVTPSAVVQSNDLIENHATHTANAPSVMPHLPAEQASTSTDGTVPLSAPTHVTSQGHPGSTQSPDQLAVTSDINSANAVIGDIQPKLTTSSGNSANVPLATTSKHAHPLFGVGNGDIMSPGRSREDLPIFTPTSSIPFGNSKVAKQETETENKREAPQSSIWEIPNTPQKH